VPKPVVRIVTQEFGYSRGAALKSTQKNADTTTLSRRGPRLARSQIGLALNLAKAVSFLATNYQSCVAARHQCAGVTGRVAVDINEITQNALTAGDITGPEKPLLGGKLEVAGGDGQKKKEKLIFFFRD